MADLVVIAGVAAFFAVAWAFVRGCDRIIGPDEPDLLVEAPTVDPAEPAAASTGAAG